MGENTKKEKLSQIKHKNLLINEENMNIITKTSKRFLPVWIMILSLLVVYPIRGEGQTRYKISEDKWQAIMDKYIETDIDTLILVKYKSGSRASLEMYQKSDKNWEKKLSCKALVGENGIDKVKEGDRKTPTGDFNPTFAFGIKKDPGTVLKYVKLNKYLYWSGSPGTYNTMVDSRKYPGVVGEHLIKHNPSYNYVIDIGYNTNCVYGKGSAIFLHCFGKGYYKGDYKYTMGCVAISKKNMKFILKNLTKNTKICIH